MEPATPEVTISNPETSQPPEIKKDNHGITIAAMALFVLASLGIVAFLYYQNQQLKSMLASYQAPATTPTPSATTDPTANWKMYTNKSLEIEFKYPENYSLLKETPNIEFGFGIGTESPSTYLTVLNYKSVDLTKITKCTEVPTEEYCLADGQGWEQATDVVDIKVDDLPAKSFYISGGVDNAYHIVQVTNKPLELKMYVAGGGLDKTFDQILSTLKFIEASSSPSTKACTLEAKICPDGSSVGRTGPNCEFAPCP